MKSNLTPFVAPVVEKPVCRACRTFAPDCIVPVDEGAVPMCWLCAHHVVDHGSAVSAAHVGECECSLEDIYPPHVLLLRRGLQHGDVDYTKPRSKDELLRGSSLSATRARC